jgi:hypothetical protein
MDSLPEDAPQPRLCQLSKWPDFDGFGFNLQLGQFIGKVDDDSPAQHAQLREGDRIIEVNGINIANENHRQVVERIKAIPNETLLLVLDRAADRYYRERNVQVNGSQSNVLQCKTPNPRPPPSSAELTIETDDTVESPTLIENEPQRVIDSQQVHLIVSEMNESHAELQDQEQKEEKVAEEQVSPVVKEVSQDDLQLLADTQVSHVIVEATNRMQQNVVSTESRSIAIKKSSLELPVDNQHTIQALTDANEQLHNLKLVNHGNDEKRSQVSLVQRAQNVDTPKIVPFLTDFFVFVQMDELSENQTESTATTDSNGVTANAASIKYHHNFIVTNSEEQFASERAQQEQAAKQQLPDNAMTKVDETDPVDRSRQHSRTNGSTGSQLSQSSGQSRLSESSSNNNDASALDLNLNMSASEMRKMLSQRKNRKVEAKKAQLDLRQKYEIIQQM